MADRELTSFERILLGMICTAPASGYDLKRIFAATPMGVYQPSSGALYPALRRLERDGLIRAETSARRAGEPARRRRVYEPTQAGRAAHASWLRTPIDPATVAGDLGLHLMRFVMMEHVFPREEVLQFLGNLADALAAFTTELERYAAASDLSDRHPGLALDHGLAVHRASLQWAEHAIAALSPAPADSGRRRGESPSDMVDSGNTMTPGRCHDPRLTR
jgi:DNA-binding PadR family transcriptional regulator